MSNKVKLLENKAKELRKTILTMIHGAQSGHPGGSLSAADIVTVLYNDEMNIKPKDPNWNERDRFILSKGHCCPVLYSALAHLEYFEYETIHTLRKMGSILQGHPDMNKVPGVDMTTGSLGQGLSIGVGIAIASKADNLKSRVFVLLGDGEINEGQVWEAAVSASKYKLDNLIAIVDYNGLQNDGFTKDIMPIERLENIWKGFGWNVVNVDGHDINDILRGFEEAKNYKGKPVAIIAKTVKGKGVSFMENVCEWHGKAPNDEQFKIAMEDLLI